MPVIQQELTPGAFLYDSLSYNFKWKKERFIRLFAERKICFRVSEEQLASGNLTLPLPYSTDPFSDARNLKQIDENLPAQFFNVRVIRFQARKLTGYGNTERVLKSATFNDDSLRLFRRDEPNFTYEFELLNLSPGDIVQIEYKYEVPYQENWIQFSSFRVFLGGKSTKKTFHFELSHEEIRRLELVGAAPDTSFSKGSTRVYQWSRQDLKENLFAFNGRPYKDVEWIGFRFNTNGEIFKDFYRGGGYRYLPYWRSVLQRRFYKLPFFYRLSKKRVLLDRQNQMIDDFIEQVTASNKKSDPAVKAMLIHQEINDSFDYLADEEYYDLEDMSLENIGVHVSQKELRDISRFHLYAKILMRMKVPFRLVLLDDSRFYRFSEGYLPKAMSNDLMFEIYGKGGAFLLWPKSNRGGLEVSEYPFYWEGATVMNVNPFDLWSRNGCDFSLDTLFYYNKHENMRMTNMKVNFDSSFVNTKFSTDIRLSGQMSTVLRNYLRYGDEDKWVNQNYYHDLFSGIDGRAEIGAELTNFQRVYPYKSSFKMNFKRVLDEVASPIAGNRNGIVEIPFEGWTNLIVFPEVFEVEDRVEPYYPDFLYDDIFNIMIEVPEDYEWTNIEEFENSFDNSFGSVSTEVTDMRNGKFLISVHFSIRQAEVAPKDFDQVKSLYRQATMVDQLSFLFRKAPPPVD